MDYEKLYKKALERASKLRFQNPFDTVSQMMEHVFPEIAESDDERIRKSLIEYFGEQCDTSDWNGVYGYQVLAWLEKQAPKPKWSEEDSLMIDSIIDTMKCLEGKGATNMKIDWLESLKQRPK